MASELPTQHVFLAPTTAATVQRIATEREVPVAAVLRAAVFYAAANPAKRFDLASKGRTKRMWFYCAPDLKAQLKQTAFYESIPMSRWIASAVEHFVAEVEREEAGRAPSAALMRTRAVLGQAISAQASA